MRSGKFLCWCALPALLAGCAANRPNKQGREASLHEPEPYVRIFSGSSNEVQLQIALRKFVPAHRKQPIIWLAGVSHLGESNYYARIQEHLDA